MSLITYEKSGIAQRPQIWLWVAILFACAATALAYGPLLIEFGGWLWIRPHYQFFPFVLVAVPLLLIFRFRSASRRTHLKGGPLPTYGLALLSWLILLSAMWIHSPLFAAISGVTLAAAAFREVDRRWQVPYLWGIWALLLLVIPLPLNLDSQLITQLQLVSSRISSDVLDGMGVLHLMEGNALRLPDKELFVDEACSGIVSILSIVAAAAILGVWWNRPALHVVLLAITGIIWATLLNVLRISAIAYAYVNFGLDWSTGVTHETLSLLLFGVAFVALLFTDQLLKAWITPISERWEAWTGSPVTYGGGAARLWDWLVRGPDENRFLEKYESLMEYEFSSEAVRYTSRWILGGIAMAFLSLSVLQWTIWPIVYAEAETVIFTTPPQVSAALSLNEDSLPSNLQGILLNSHRTEQRETNNFFGQYSKVYEYRDINSRPVMISCDFAFPGAWHELTICYGMVGWKLNSRSVRGISPTTKQRDQAVEAHFRQPNGQYAAVLFCEFDENGVPLEPPTKSFEENFSRALSRRSLTADIGDVFQVQVLLTSPIPISEERVAEGLQWLRKARDEFRSKVTSDQETS